MSSQSSSQSRPPTSAHRAPTSRGQGLTPRTGAIAHSGNRVPRSSHTTNATNLAVQGDRSHLAQGVGSRRSPKFFPATPASLTDSLDREDVASAPSVNLSLGEVGVLPLDSPSAGPWNGLRSQASSLDGALGFGHLQSLGAQPAVQESGVLESSPNAPGSPSSVSSDVGRGAEVLQRLILDSSFEDLSSRAPVPSWASATADRRERIVVLYLKVFGRFPSTEELDRLVDFLDQGDLATPRSDILVEPEHNTSSGPGYVADRKSIDTDDSGGATYHTPPTTASHLSFAADNEVATRAMSVVGSLSSAGTPPIGSRANFSKLDKHASMTGVFSGSPTRPDHGDDEDDYYDGLAHASPTPSFRQALTDSLFSLDAHVQLNAPIDVNSGPKSRFSADMDDVPAPHVVPQLAAPLVPLAHISATPPISATQSGSVTPSNTAQTSTPLTAAAPSMTKSWSKIAQGYFGSKKDESKARGKEKEGKEKEKEKGKEKGREKGKEKGREGKVKEEVQKREMVDLYLKGAQPADIDGLLFPPTFGQDRHPQSPGLRGTRSETYLKASWESLQDNHPPRNDPNSNPVTLPPQEGDNDPRDAPSPSAVNIGSLTDPTKWENAAFLDLFLSSLNPPLKATALSCDCPRLGQQRVCACPSSTIVYMQQRQRSSGDAQTRRRLLIGEIIKYIRVLAESSQTTDSNS